MSYLHTGTTSSLTLLAPAKLNLTFHILGKRPDGYHDVLTLLTTIDLCDTLMFDFVPAEKNTVKLANTSDTTLCDFPLDDSNLITQAANLFWSSVPRLSPVRLEVSVQKKIPIGAGLAGGSADAAATLIAMSSYYEKPFRLEELAHMGSVLGADVPFSIAGGMSLGRGRGEELSPVLLEDELFFVLVKPKDLSVSTKWAYNSFDSAEQSLECQSLLLEDHKQAIACLIKPNLSEAAKHLSNCFESLVFERYPVLSKIKARLTELGCLAAHMTGSGPTIYGLTESLCQAQNVSADILCDQTENGKALWFQDHPLPADVWVTKSTTHGVTIISNDKTYEQAQVRH